MPNKHSYYVSAMITLLGAYHPMAVCNEAIGASSLFDLSLHELANIQVSVASRTQEALTLTPASVTVFTYQQIINMGILTLEDLLNYVPGMQVSRTEEVGTKVSTAIMRGRRSVHSSPEILFLMDGLRLNTSWTGGALAVHNNITLDNVKQIEVIRGPGSALYGSNAFLGVVNIITDTERNKAGYRKGNFNSNDVYAHISKQSRDSNWNVSLFARSFSDDGSQIELPYTFAGYYPELPATISTKDPIEGQDIYLTAQSDSVKFNIRHAERHQADFSQFARVYDGFQRNKQESSSYNLIYNAVSNDYWDVNLSASYVKNDTDFIGLVFPVGVLQEIGLIDTSDTVFGGTILKSNQTSIGAVAHSIINEYSEILYGLNWHQEEINEASVQNNLNIPDLIEQNTPVLTLPYLRNSTLGKSGKRSVSSMYGQYKGRTDTFSYYAGLRYDHYSDFGDNVSPRLAFISDPLPGTTIKLLYGESFRAPSIRQLSNFSLSFIGNSKLKPEISKTAELVWLQNINHAWQYSITLFDTKIEDGMILVDVQPEQVNFDSAGFGTLTIENSDHINLQGLEAGFMMNSWKGFTLKANITKLTKLPGDSKSASDFQYSVVSNYHYNKFNFNVNGYGYSKTVHSSGEQLSGYGILNGSVRYELYSDTILSINSLNLLNKKFSTNTLTKEYSTGLPGRSRFISFGIEIIL